MLCDVVPFDDIALWRNSGSYQGAGESATDESILGIARSLLALATKEADQYLPAVTEVVPIPEKQGWRVRMRRLLRHIDKGQLSLRVLIWLEPD